MSKKKEVLIWVCKLLVLVAILNLLPILAIMGTIGYKGKFEQVSVEFAQYKNYKEQLAQNKVVIANVFEDIKNPPDHLPTVDLKVGQAYRIYVHLIDEENSCRWKLLKEPKSAKNIEWKTVYNASGIMYTIFIIDGISYEESTKNVWFNYVDIDNDDFPKNVKRRFDFILRITK